MNSLSIQARQSIKNGMYMMLSSRRLRYAAWIAAAVSILVTAGYFFIDRHQKPGSLPEKITIAHSTLPYAALAQVAQVRGYYLQEGLEVTPQIYPYGKLALQAVLQGKADFATVAETPVMFAIMNGEKIGIIATIQSSKRSHAILARKDSGIVTPDDLRGKKIAATYGTTGEFFMDAFMVGHGIARKDMKVIYLKPGEMPDALADGEVDAVSVWHPFLNSARKKLRGKEVIFYDENIYRQTFNIVALQRFIAENPGAAEKMLRALIRAEIFAGKEPAEAQKIVAEFNAMDPAELQEIWADNRFTVTLDQSLLLGLEDETRWAISNRLTHMKTIPNYLDFIYFKSLESVRPKAVSILR